jgi:hypothetical protein
MTAYKKADVIYWELVALASHYENKAENLRNNGLDDEAEAMDQVANKIINISLELEQVKNNQQEGQTK